MSTTPEQQFFDIFDAFATDPDLENNGKWFPIGPKARVKVAREGNDKYNALFKKLVEENSLDLQDGGPGADALASDIMLRVEAATVLVDWDGIGFQGQPVTYSPEMAKTMLGVKDFRKRIQALSKSMENFRVKVEEQQGNV